MLVTTKNGAVYLAQTPYINTSPHPPPKHSSSQHRLQLRGTAYSLAARLPKLGFGSTRFASTAARTAGLRAKKPACSMPKSSYNSKVGHVYAM